jgi:hypothetical protein
MLRDARESYWTHSLRNTSRSSRGFNRSPIRIPPSVSLQRLKVRFWVNGDGFVTRAFVAGFTVATSADQEAELDFVQHLTFTVPGTQECRTRPLEMIANFSESRESGGEWATVLEVHPLYAFEGDQVVVRP